ncbi:DUF3846 domain-containing protein [Pseudarthrobacter sp. HLT3-5]|uniref:DUF3846 domain-containing protein n=1 Tax=Pseudarthrobacter cellobiosi TaxID=2953654 RepID=UPI00208FB42B|nr:DUF3846 domain-containing protein [Pseudarthrobacter sp. HLT3-5]MCO4274304.1 DUF3846 domain-containing protein [Pseudarthrobacter sp. HLT3-5]
MIHAILVPADEERPLYKVAIEGLTGLQAAVGGLIEVMDIDRPDATLILNEEGKVMGLPMNRRATLLLWVHLTRWRGHDALAGDVLIVGRPDDEGNMQDVPRELVELLFKTKVYKYEVTTVSDLDVWNGNQRRYEDWVTAYNDGLALASRWFAVNDVRIVPA